MLDFGSLESLDVFSFTLVERIIFHADMSPNFKPWTNAVYQSLKEIADAPRLKIFPEARCYVGEYLCDFMIFEEHYGCRVACESQWKHSGSNHINDLRWAFDKLRGVKSDLKLFVFEGTDEEWLVLVSEYLEDYAQISLSEAFLALRWDGVRFSRWGWIAPKAGLQMRPITFHEFAGQKTELNPNVLEVYGNNAAVRCPSCNRVYLISSLINRANGRQCPTCLQSRAKFIGRERVEIVVPD